MSDGAEMAEVIWASVDDHLTNRAAVFAVARGPGLDLGPTLP